MPGNEGQHTSNGAGKANENGPAVISGFETDCCTLLHRKDKP